MESAGTRLTVGQLAEAVGVTPKALRHYDRVGLFRPDGVDEGNGYRWYRAERVPDARLIARLRTVGVPLDAVAECVEAAVSRRSSSASSRSTRVGWRRA